MHVMMKRRAQLGVWALRAPHVPVQAGGVRPIFERLLV
jgi:hypothetical protein